jgi:hypothetical protein
VRLLSLDDEEFLATINDNALRKDYKKKLKVGQRTVNREFRQEKKRLKETLPKEIDTYESHDEIVNMSIFPFVQSGTLSQQLGYKFRCCDPLYEDNLPNFDFLIVKNADRHIVAIFGEAKTADERPQTIISDIIRKRETVEQYQNSIRTKYLDGTQLNIMFEYVVSVDAYFSDNMRNTIEKYFNEHGQQTAHKMGS